MVTIALSIASQSEPFASMAATTTRDGIHDPDQPLLLPARRRLSRGLACLHAADIAPTRCAQNTLIILRTASTSTPTRLPCSTVNPYA